MLQRLQRTPQNLLRSKVVKGRQMLIFFIFFQKASQNICYDGKNSKYFQSQLSTIGSSFSPFVALLVIQDFSSI